MTLPPPSALLSGSGSGFLDFPSVNSFRSLPLTPSAPRARAEYIHHVRESHTATGYPQSHSAPHSSHTATHAAARRARGPASARASARAARPPAPVAVPAPQTTLHMRRRTRRTHTNGYPHSLLFFQRLTERERERGGPGGGAWRASSKDKQARQGLKHVSPQTTVGVAVSSRAACARTRLLSREILYRTPPPWTHQRLRFFASLSRRWRCAEQRYHPWLRLAARSGTVATQRTASFGLLGITPLSSLGRERPPPGAPPPRPTPCTPRAACPGPGTRSRR